MNNEIDSQKDDIINFSDLSEIDDYYNDERITNLSIVNGQPDIINLSDIPYIYNYPNENDTNIINMITDNNIINALDLPIDYLD